MQIIQVFINNPLRNFNYILYSEITHEAIIFDPTDLDYTLPVLNEKKLQAKYLLNTHHHYDHIHDNARFLEIPGTEKLTLKDGEEFYLSEQEKVVCQYGPGHVAEHMCYFLYQGDKLTGVITGDTLFNCGVGNCKNGGDPEQLFTTIKDQFFSLADDVIVYPSHDFFLNNLQFAKTVDPDNQQIDEYIKKVTALAAKGQFLQTTIGDEKKINPFLRSFDFEFQKQLNLGAKDLFLEFRKKRDIW
jgi:hydroxyacylglutathione hydrolase